MRARMVGEGFDFEGLAAAVARHRAVVRVLVAEFRGSTPRETGTAMLVWASGTAGTVGGGALELAAVEHARRLLGTTGAWGREILRLPLGPALGQCCGGAVTLLLERFAGAEIAALGGIVAAGGPFMRPVASGAAPDPAALDMRRARRAARSGEGAGRAERVGDTMIEPFAEAALPVWLYGAGHVGRAIVRATEGLPLALTWIDTAAERFPDPLPGTVAPLVAAEPARAVPLAPDDAAHLVMTYSHALDLAICHAVLSRPFRHLGLIGSASKKARFLSRLRAMGHAEAALARLACPIGDRSLGKRPAAIALGVGVELLRLAAAADAGRRAG